MDSRRLEAYLSLLRAEESGALDSLECPDCHNPSVSVRFTQPQIGVYRTWFLCSECRFQTRAQDSRRPTHYSEDRVDKRLEEYDSELMRKMRFPPPDKK